VTSASQDAMSEGKVIQLSEEALLRLLNEAKNGGGYLPPGAYRNEDGVPYRDVPVPTGRVREVKDAADKVVKRQAIYRKQQRLVMLVADPTPGGLVETAKKCKRAANEHGPDFYHPRLGWIRWGTKREVDVAENLGTGAEHFEMVYEDIENEDTVGVSSATMQGVPTDDDAPFADHVPSVDDGREMVGGGRRKGA
jgi:hypothetical protein